MKFKILALINASLSDFTVFFCAKNQPKFLHGVSRAWIFTERLKPKFKEIAIRVTPEIVTSFVYL